MRKTPAVVVATALVGGALALWSSPAQAITGPVDIRVEHDLDDDGSGPRVLEVTGVTPGAGPEITVADETSNPSDWSGNVLVDIDPDADTITVEVEDPDCYDSVIVQITTDEVGSVSVLSDDLFDPEDESGPVTLTTAVDAGGVTLAWNSDEDDCPGLSEAGSQAVFSYGPAGPVARLSPGVVEQGDPVTVTGTQCPSSPVQVVVAPEGGGDPVLEDEVLGDEAGDWSYAVDTTELEPGAYEVLASCVFVEGQGFDYEVLAFEVSAEPVVAPTALPAQPAAAAPSFTG